MKKGQRVEIAPSYDLWMRGARYGEVMTEPDNRHAQGRLCCAVKLDKVRKLQWFPVKDLTPV